MSELTTNPGQEQDTTPPPMVFNPTPRQWGFTRSCVQLYGRNVDGSVQQPWLKQGPNVILS